MSSIDDATVADLLDAIAARTPAPGGGAVASVVGALAASLAGMVVAYSIGRRALAEHAEELEVAARRLVSARTLLLTLADEDAAAYAHLNALDRLHEDDKRRQTDRPAAIDRAIQAPRAVLAGAVDLARLLEALCEITNRHLRSDLGIAAVLAEATARSAAWNIRINLSLCDNTRTREQLAADMVRSLDEVTLRVGRVEAACGRS